VQSRSNSIVPDSANLDLLRAVAVLFVFFAHLILCLADTGHYQMSDYPFWKLQLTELGHVGVLFFFVHTALVLMMSLERTAGRQLVLNFYIRRIFRIYPLSISCVIVVLLFHVPQVPDGKFVAWSWDQIVPNLLLIQNIFQKQNVIAPLWTLPREFQMYLVLPFLYLLLKRFSSSIVVLLLWVGFFAAVPFAPLLESFPCFMGGLFAYQLGKERTFALRGGVWPASIAILFVLHALSMMSPYGDFDRNDYVLCMFLGAVIPNVTNLKKSWVTSACRSIAKYSYGIYLCHDPVLWFSFVKLGWLPVAIQWITLVLLMIGVPFAAYHLLESPLIGIGRRIADRWSALGAPERLQFQAAGVEKTI
jgi:peptidoglycan/LPS O-acetylase OafA/YrhL